MIRIVAHRAGNRPETAQEANAAGTAVELDVHVLNGRVEVRHAKVLWPTKRLWERWYLLPAGTRGVAIEEILAAVPPDADLLLDLKCFTARAARKILAAVPAGHRLVISSRAWWLLAGCRDRADTIVLRSCGARWQLWLACRLPGLGTEVGVVAHERLLNPGSLAVVKGRTPQLYSWAADTVKRGRELAEGGVVGLIVDDWTLEWPG